MESILKKINGPEDLKKLNVSEKQVLAEEIRKEILEVVSKNGGHLASNLGVVELTIALHSVFNTPDDKIIWDVGHQCYTHKILTGRKEQFSTLRKLNGIAGFPKVCESEYDTFNTGHSSTSISVATGMARAKKLMGDDQTKVIAVIGDGSMTGGMALEALNDAGSSKTNIIVILNDNEMSISKNVGGIPLFLSKLRGRKFYSKSNERVKKFMLQVPVIGNPTVKIVQKIKDAIKQILLPNMFFEDIGFTYLGPVDGHNIDKLESILETSKKISGPVLVHVITKKGKGYKFAEETPENFHGVSSFDLKTGEKIKKSGKDYSKVFGEKLVELAEKNEKIVAVTAAMKDGTGLKSFSEKFPDRFFDVGIAEQHAIGMIAGMAKEGLKPVLAIYSSFLQRGYDQLVHDIALQKLPVVICIDRAGIVGNDGETHHGIFDLSFLSSIPNLTVMAPKDFEELKNMLEFAVNFNGPILIRYPRGGENHKFTRKLSIKLGKAELIRQGKDITIIGIGKTVGKAVEVAELLKKQNINSEVINARFLKPLDEKFIVKSIKKTGRVATIEDNTLKGGLGSSVIELVNKSNLQNIKVETFGYDDCFVPHGGTEELEKIYKQDVESIAEQLAKS
ncbi:MAG: 1-deoxy-D-xylulose-5-phosphate synthase [Clostridia bacterium]